MSPPTEPTVSIVLPTYNRAALLQDCLNGLAAQTFTDWHLICVDDGSTDRNREVMDAFRQSVAQPVEYTYQTNAGAGAARAAALRRVRGRYVAFMDSDDPWLPHHLDTCVRTLDQHPEIDWLVGPARVVDLRTGAVVDDNSFLDDDGRFGPGLARLRLVEVKPGLWRADDDRLTETTIRYGAVGGLQASVLRRWVVERVPLRPYRLFDDSAFQIEAAAAGAKQAFLPARPHIEYRIHTENVSLVNDAGGQDRERRLAVQTNATVMLRDLLGSGRFSPAQRRCLRAKLAGKYIWDIAFNIHLKDGRSAAARQALRAGLRVAPFHAGGWKLYLTSYLPGWGSSARTGDRDRQLVA